MNPMILQQLQQLFMGRGQQMPPGVAQMQPQGRMPQMGMGGGRPSFIDALVGGQGGQPQIENPPLPPYTPGSEPQIGGPLPPLSPPTGGTPTNQLPGRGPAPLPMPGTAQKQPGSTMSRPFPGSANAASHMKSPMWTGGVRQPKPTPGGLGPRPDKF